MLTSLSTKNFKSWKHLEDLRFGKVNLLFGENSSGKTSLLQLLLLLKQTVESFDRAQPLNLGSPGSLVDLGLYEDMVYEHDKNLPFRFRFEWTEQNARDSKEQDASLDVLFSYPSDSIRVDAMKVCADGTCGELKRDTQTGKFGVTMNGENVIRPGLFGSQLMLPIKCYGFPPAAILVDPGLSDLSLYVEQYAKRIYYMGPLRVSPQRQYLWSGSAPEGVGNSGETAIQAILASVVKHHEKSDEPLPDLVSSTEHWLIRLGLAESFSVVRIPGTSLYQVELKVPGFSTKANLADVGVGVSQVLPVVILAHFAPEGSIIVLEQPELHLHPSGQAVLAELFFELSMKRNVQFIVETHSEHLLTRLQRKVAESDRESITEEIKLYVCKKEQDQSKIEPLQLDSSGQILNWPPKFFGDTLSDKEAIMKAYFQKQKRSKNRE